MTIADFLKARIAEDEIGASQRMLAEATAKLTILAEHVEVLWTDAWGKREMTCRICGGEGQAYPCVTIGALLAIYDDHPDHKKWAA